MIPVLDFDTAFAANPLIAILRGLRADEADAIGDALVEAGFTLIEVPLNSPNPLDSIARLSRRVTGRAIIGAGTVLRPEQVAEVAAAGGRIIVSPDTNVAVLAAARAAGLTMVPGMATPSEAFTALCAGARALKLFPAEAFSPAVVGAMLAVLPTGTPILPVGGITPDGMAAWLRAGAMGFGLGSALYKPGMDGKLVGANARAFVDKLQQLRAAGE